MAGNTHFPWHQIVAFSPSQPSKTILKSNDNNAVHSGLKSYDTLVIVKKGYQEGT